MSSLSGIEDGPKDTGGIPVMLVCGEHLACLALRRVLAEMLYVQLAADVPAGPSTVTANTCPRPAIVIVGTGRISDETATLLHELRRCFPRSKVVVFSDTVSPARTMATGASEADRQLAWADVTCDSLPALLATLMLELWTDDRPAIARLSTNGFGSAGEPTIQLTAADWMIIDGYDNDLSAKQIATLQGIGERTVEHAIDSLKAKLGVKGKSLYWLGKMIGRLDLGN